MPDNFYEFRFFTTIAHASKRHGDEAPGVTLRETIADDPRLERREDLQSLLNKLELDGLITADVLLGRGEVYRVTEQGAAEYDKYLKE
jgi:hypothetical protein